MDIQPAFMERALELAYQGGRAVMPNPMVGAVIAHNNIIIGEGFHQVYGGPHAEVHALREVGNRELLSGATLYVTLEPCSHLGKTPPCADALIASGLKRVVVGCKDPNPKVSGSGIQKLRDAGISVIEGVKERECVMLNRRFILFHKLKRPYVILKWAETADGFIARPDGSSKWISGEFSRRTTHRWRANEMSILVGANTARIDNPELTVRHVEGTNPLRIVIDRELTIPRAHALFSKESETWVFNSRREGSEGRVHYKLLSPASSVPQHILSSLFQAAQISLIVEGGASTLKSFIDAGLWDEARVFQSKKTFGLGIKAPRLDVEGHTSMPSGRDRIEIFQHRALAERLGIGDSSVLRIERDL
jgi:diaminohydroxyphosphoribosylaminopyrimidine deaminase/5-amino-6-(5-phosphoribosylamino)uracil reductase